jgi:flagellar biosynthesis protein FlhA
VLQMLLREEVSIRQLGPILETLADSAVRASDPIELVERVRRRLARAICRRYCDRDNRLQVVTLDPALEERIRAGCQAGGEGLSIQLSPAAVEEICRLIDGETSKLTAAGRPPVVLCSPSVRPAVKQLTASHIPQLVVLSFSEITRDTRIESVGLVLDSGVSEEILAAAAA